MNRDRIVAIVREHAAEIRARGVTSLGLFGSVARGDGGEASDIDVVVDVAPDRKFSLVDLAGLQAFLCEIFDRDTDIVVRDDLRADFRRRVDRDTLQVL